MIRFVCLFLKRANETILIKTQLLFARDFWEQCGLVLDHHMITCPVGLHEAKPVGDSLTQQGPADFGTAQNSARTLGPVCCFLSHNVESLDGFWCHFVSHA